MTRTLLIVAACLLVPGMAAAQFGDEPAPAAYPQPAPRYQAEMPASAPASAAVLQGFVLSLELGYAPAIGDADKTTTGTGEAMTDVVSSHVPLVLGVGYRINPLVSVGGIFQYGFAQLDSSACPSGVSCSASDLRLGAEVRLHFLSEQPFSPWVSAGFGYEWFNVDMSQGSLSANLTYKGFEFLNLEAGGDFRVSPSFTLGPFIGLRVQQFDSMSGTNSSGTNISQEIPSDQKAVHGWVAFGLRGMFTL